MIAKMGEIVWALNEKNDSLQDLLAYCRSYAVEYLTENGIPCQVQMPENIAERSVNSEIRRNVYLVIKEVLHNIVKHAGATLVRIQIAASDKLSVAIEDNGTGFEANKIGPYSNGINNMKKRIRELGGELHLHSESGTRIEFSIPMGLTVE
jgi:signal transduction histidine kinase